MSRAHPHYFPSDTPEPVAEPYSAIDELLQLVQAWLAVAAMCCGLIALLAFFCPSFFTLFR